VVYLKYISLGYISAKMWSHGTICMSERYCNE